MASSSASVPVAVFSHRRPEQLARALDCLRDNRIEQLYVFSDGPRSPAEADAVEAVRELVRSLDWTEPVLISRPVNLGLSESIRQGLDWLFERHASAIVIEDDVAVAPEFYGFARSVLAHYQAEPRVAGLTGLRLPFPTRALDRYPYDAYLAPRFHSWGWATWAERWREFCFDRATLHAEMQRSARFRPQRAGADMPRMLHEAVVTGTLEGSWDVLCATNMLLHDQYFVMPAWNMVENMGFADGSHYRGDAPWHLRWEAERRPAGDLRLPPVAPSEPVLRDYRRAFRRRRLHELAHHLRLSRRGFAPR